MIDSSESHFVCVCAIHQNTILACCASNLDYKDLINKVVCSNTNKLCVVHYCLNCPGKADEIDFQQLESTDRTIIVNMVMEKF